MLIQEEATIISISNAIDSYKGFTKGEKAYAIEHLEEWLGETCNLDQLINNFSELSLDAKPFLEDSGLI